MTDGGSWFEFESLSGPSGLVMLGFRRGRVGSSDSDLVTGGWAEVAR